ncbi:MAG: ATP-binding protein [Trueperaceae bacterium]
MGLRARILFGYAVAIALMGSLVVWAMVHVVSLGRASDAILSENYASILAAENMVNALEWQDRGLLLILAGDPDVGAARMHGQDAVFREWLALAEQNVTIPGEGDLVRSLAADYEAFRARVGALIDAWDASQGPGDPAVYSAEVVPSLTRVRDDAIGLRVLNESEMYAASDRAGDEAARAVRSIALAAAVVLLLAVATSLVFAERHVRPIRDIAEAAQRIANGDYAVAVPVQGRDEVGRLATEFNRMARELGAYHALRVDELVLEKGKLEAVLAGIDDGLLVFDAGLGVVSVNPAARRMLDLEEAGGADRPCGELLPFPEVCDLVQQAIDTGAAPELPDAERMLVFATRAGHRHCQFAVTPILGREGQPSGAVLLLRDLTRLMDVERLKSEFVTAASHELRTPLTSLSMSVDLLLERIADDLAERDRELLEAAHEEVHRMKTLIDDLLDLSRIEAGRIELTFANVAVADLFEHVETIFESQLKEKGILLNVEGAADLPNVRADANKATWVLTNLVSNALRYVPERGHIGLSARRAGRFVQVSVTDDGPGIPPGVRDRIFEKFVKVKGQQAGGSGLGLAICKEIVRAHGGTIWVAPSSERGTTFTFTLPSAG